MKILKQAAMAALLSLGVFRAHGSQTNVVQNLSIQLQGVQSGGTISNRYSVTTGFAPVSIDTRKIIQTLGAATGNTYANRARLVVVTPLGGGVSSIQVRDGTSINDVTGFFVHEQLGGSVSGSTSNVLSGRTFSLDFSIQRLALQDANGATLGLHFDVSGFAQENGISSVSGASELYMDVAGSGDVSGTPAVVRGSVAVQGATLEVVAGGGIGF